MKVCVRYQIGGNCIAGNKKYFCDSCRHKPTAESAFDQAAAAERVRALALHPGGYHFPESKFVDLHDSKDQSSHIRSEFIEWEEENPGTWQELMEAWDLLHSIETWIRIRAKEGIDVVAAKAAVMEKNRVRGYYETTAKDRKEKCQLKHSEHCAVNKYSGRVNECDCGVTAAKDNGEGK